EGQRRTRRGAECGGARAGVDDRSAALAVDDDGEPAADGRLGRQGVEAGGGLAEAVARGGDAGLEVLDAGAMVGQLSQLVLAGLRDLAQVGLTVGERGRRRAGAGGPERLAPGGQQGDALAAVAR